MAQWQPDSEAFQSPALHIAKPLAIIQKDPTYMKILKNSRVRLKTFQGLSNFPYDVDDNDNYWKLIGQCGTVIDNELEDKEKVLVLFDVELDNFQLANHNQIKNSLMIKIKDLDLVV